MAPKCRRGTTGGHEDNSTPPILAASPFAQATAQEGGANNPQMVMFVQEFMVEIR
ncbi:hypothetical protein SLEP1_g26059 [Rubroshorea leprosula]|uniref:Uncharacterized protein n=1 Tax=Rubroshorea leprosula TaxID=152421 RepID=A0AAV5JKZ7_9ROSI|nr:hypothetical protein SLEP1_g26059 [Rubroshorea leprosula]